MKVAFSSPIIQMRAFVTIRAAEVGCSIGGIDVLDRKPLADDETDIAVQVPPAVHVQLGPEEIALRRGVIGNDVLTASEGRG